MGILDAPLSAAVNSLLGSIGGTCVLKKVDTKYDALAGNKQVLSSQSWTLPCSPEMAFSKRMFQISLGDEVAIQEGDFVIIIPAAFLNAQTPPVIPTIHMTITRAGVTSKIVAVDPINTGDQVAAYQLLCRR